MTDSVQGTGIHEFLAARGGPFYELQHRLKLLHHNALNVGRRTLIFVALAWGVPFILTLPGSFSLAQDQNSFLSDPAAWAKFIIGIAAFIFAEQQVERGLRLKLTQFLRAPLIAPAAVPAAAKAVNTALKRRDSHIGEIICLILAAIAAVGSFLNFHTISESSWAVTHLPEGNAITLAGWWCVLVSLPLFVFLFTRGIWRHFVWAQLLRKIASLDLRLVATHPDGKAGLAFLADYPNAYVFFVFGISSAVAAALAKHVLQTGVDAKTFSMIMAGWLVIVMALFAYPLSAFSKPLARLKEQGLLMLGAQATRYQRQVERKTAGQNLVANDPAEAQQQVDVEDPSKLFEATRKLSTMLISRKAVVPVAAAALLPFAAAGATQLPYKEVFSVLKKLLLL